MNKDQNCSDAFKDINKGAKTTISGSLFTEL